MNSHVRILNAWSRTGDVLAPLLERAGYTVQLTRVHSPEAAREAASHLPYDLALTEMAHAGGGSRVLDAVSDVAQPPSGIFVNASPLGLRHGVTSSARAGFVLPFRLLDLLSVAEAVLAMHRVERPQRPLFSVAKLVANPQDFWSLSGPSVMMDSSRALLAARGEERGPVRLTGGCAQVRRAAARLIHTLGDGRRFLIMGPNEAEDVLAGWQLAGDGTLYLEDLEQWEPEQLARLNRCLERDGLLGPRLVAGSDSAISVGSPRRIGVDAPTSIELDGLLDGVLAQGDPIELPDLGDRTADLFALLEGRLCRGGQPRWLTGVELAGLLGADWRGMSLRSLEWRLPERVKAKRPLALAS